VRERCCEAYARLCPDDLSQFLLPGVVDLLESLSGRDDVILALVTGNYEVVARLKLARAGIGAFFRSRQGAFGSDDEDRAALPAIARRRAGSVGHPHPRQDTIVIGDTPRDIACAAADGVRCFAVASGPFGAEELAGAQAVFGNAAELSAGLVAELESRASAPGLGTASA
jgi:phosphoglycolate phosphatase-like HAD superfamily hydrolase